MEEGNKKDIVAEKNDFSYAEIIRKRMEESDKKKAETISEKQKNLIADGKKRCIYCKEETPPNASWCPYCFPDGLNPKSDSTLAVQLIAGVLGSAIGGPGGFAAGMGVARMIQNKKNKNKKKNDRKNLDKLIAAYKQQQDVK